jgi:signal transduction histidine kinase
VTAPSPPELLAMIIHDLKNPLVSVAGNAEYLLRAPELSDDTREALAELVESAALVEGVLADTATLGRALAGRLAPVGALTDLAGIARALAAEARVRAARLQVSIHVDGDGAQAVGVDAEIVRRALRGLLGFALRRAPAGTRVTIALAGAQQGGARVDVQDEGPHLEERRLTALLGPAGGVGLMLARTLCEVHAGSLRAENTDAGLRTTIELPPLAPKE